MHVTYLINTHATHILNLIANDHFIEFQHKCKADVLPWRYSGGPVTFFYLLYARVQVPERLLAASLPPAPLELPRLLAGRGLKKTWVDWPRSLVGPEIQDGPRTGTTQTAKQPLGGFFPSGT